MTSDVAGAQLEETGTSPFGLRFLLASVAGVALVLLALGIPTDLVPNPWFVRMTPPGLSNYFFWIATSILSGALLATHVLPRAEISGSPGRAGIGGGVLGLLAAGCPVCNKLVVLLLGVSGAPTYFQPIQPFLGASGVLVAGAALIVRVRGARRACSVPRPRTVAPPSATSSSPGSGDPGTGGGNSTGVLGAGARSASS